MQEWQCEGCGTIYAEYINGCPKCWEKGLKFSVVLIEIKEILNA